MKKNIYKLTVYQKSLTINKNNDLVNRWFRIRTLFYYTKKDAFKAFKADYPSGYKVVLRLKK